MSSSSSSSSGDSIRRSMAKKGGALRTTSSSIILIDDIEDEKQDYYTQVQSTSSSNPEDGTSDQSSSSSTPSSSIGTILQSFNADISWRLKERMKTVSVALVLCLNIGVDPPDLVRPSPCATLECWIDPSSQASHKSLESIGKNLQLQYERLQPKARYKQALDPTMDDVKKLCVSLRRSSKKERVLFHYNGHGVPKPTSNGEVWVFNKSYTQYIPVSVFDLQTWLGSPTVYVFDSSNAGVIVHSFLQFAEQRAREQQQNLNSSKSKKQHNATQDYILLAACQAHQTLALNPELPADVFTACLTTPLKMALRWFRSRSLLSDVSVEDLDNIPGKFNDRRTPLGELHWIFTAVTDTIAWNVLPKDLFQRLFRQDLLLASLFRNFLLAERVMRSQNCTPISVPELPPTFQHPMWQAWDMAVDMCLAQLPQLLKKDKEAAAAAAAAAAANSLNPNYSASSTSSSNTQSTNIHAKGPELRKSYSSINLEDEPSTDESAQASSSSSTASQSQYQYIPSEFFSQQLSAFEVWLQFGNESKEPPSQLPIVLQVLLSQSHRSRALRLLALFLDLGPWAVHQALTVGIFPYVLRLLASKALDLRETLVFIWAKILAYDISCQVDLVKANGHAYFIKAFRTLSFPPNVRVMALFVLCAIMDNFHPGQKACLEAHLLNLCVAELQNQNPFFRRWVCLCLGKLWENHDAAKWQAIGESVPEKLCPLLKDENPHVRAAAAFAISTFVGGERSEEKCNVEFNLGITLFVAINDASPIVRKEVVIALERIVAYSKNEFLEAARATKLAQDEALYQLEQMNQLNNGSSAGDEHLMRLQEQLPFMSDEESGRAGSPRRRGKRTESTDSNSGRGKSSRSSRSNRSNRTSDDSESSSRRRGMFSPMRGRTTREEEDERDKQQQQRQQARHQQETQHHIQRRQMLRQKANNEFLSGEISASNSDDFNGTTSDQGESSVDSVDYTFEEDEENESTSVHEAIWHILLTFTYDPFPEVANVAMHVEAVMYAFLEELRVFDEESRGLAGTAWVPLDDSSSQRESSRSSGMALAFGTSSGMTASSSSNDLAGVSSTDPMDEDDIASVSSMRRKGNRVVLKDSQQSSTGESKRRDSVGSNRSSRSTRSTRSNLGSTALTSSSSSSRNLSSLSGNGVDGDADWEPEVDPVSMLTVSQFYSWNCEYFSHPIGDQFKEEEGPSPLALERKWRQSRNEGLLKESGMEHKRNTNSTKMDRQIMILDNEANVATNILFHPYEDVLLAADEHNQLNVWNWSEGFKMNVFDIGVPYGSRVSYLSLMNDHNKALAVVGSDDGCLRIWADVDEPGEQELRTSWRAIPELGTNVAGTHLVTEWLPYKGWMVSGGDINFMRVWDVNTELSVREVETGCDHLMTSLSTNVTGNLVFAGFGNGTVNLYDVREKGGLVQTFQEHNQWIIDVHIQQAGDGRLVSGSLDGEIKLWDHRKSSSSKTIVKGNNNVMSSLAVHDYGPFVAGGFQDHFIEVYSMQGDRNTLSRIKHHEGFMGQRIGQVETVCFHPHRYLLAASAKDAIISIYC